MLVLWAQQTNLAYSSTDPWLSLLLQWLCWNRNWVADLRITQPGWGVSGALFLGSSRVHPTLMMACKRLPRTGTARRKRTPDIRGLP
jgi:hypothetical protein